MHKKIVLPNGLRLVLVPVEGNQTVTAMVLVEAGSNYETKENNGVSHFLEHMCFKGTEKRTCADITFELDAVGAESNAFTGNEYTGYYAKAASKRLPALLDVLSDVYLNSTFPSEEIEKEKGVIVEEINMYEDMPQRKVWEVLESLMYGDTPAGRTILGPRENIRGMKREDFLAYRAAHYHPQNTVVVIAGGFDSKEATKLVKDAFGSMKPGKKKGKEKVREAQKTPAVRIHEKKSDQTHLVLAFRTIGLAHDDKRALGAVSSTLGSGMSSRLFKRLRDELGVCYYVRAHHDTYSDHGYLAVSAGVANDRVEEALEAIVEELRKLRDAEVTKAEHDKVLSYVTGRMAMGLESSDSYADFYGFPELHGRPLESLSAKIKKVRSTTPAEIRAAAKKYIVAERANLAIVGPKRDEKKLLAIVERVSAKGK